MNDRFVDRKVDLDLEVDDELLNRATKYGYMLRHGTGATWSRLFYVLVVCGIFLRLLYVSCS